MALDLKTPVNLRLSCVRCILPQVFLLILHMRSGFATLAQRADMRGLTCRQSRPRYNLTARCTAGPAKDKSYNKSEGKLDTPEKFITVREKLVAAGVKQPQAEAIMAFVAAAISPISSDLKGVTRLLYGLYAAGFLVLLELTGKEDSIIAGLLQAGAKKFFGI